MPVYAFRADGAPTLFGIGSVVEAQKYATLLNRSRTATPYQVATPTDGEVALHAGRTFSIKQKTVRLLLGK